MLYATFVYRRSHPTRVYWSENGDDPCRIRSEHGWSPQCGEDDEELVIRFKPQQLREPLSEWELRIDWPSHWGADDEVRAAIALAEQALPMWASFHILDDPKQIHDITDGQTRLVRAGIVARIDGGSTVWLIGRSRAYNVGDAMVVAAEQATVYRAGYGQPSRLALYGRSRLMMGGPQVVVHSYDDSKVDYSESWLTTHDAAVVGFARQGHVWLRDQSAIRAYDRRRTSVFDQRTPPALRLVGRGVPVAPASRGT